MNSDLQHLPPGVVAYLDALSRAGADPKALHSDFLAHLDMVGEWVDNLSGYTMDDAEIDQFANVSTFLESLRLTAEEVTWAEQLPLLYRDLYPMFRLMDRINKRREVAHHSEQPAVNDFLLCGVGYLKKRARWPALENRLIKLEHYVDNLEAGLGGLRSRLRPEVVTSLQAGLQQMRAGIEALTAEMSESETQRVLASVSEGAGVMQLLIDWKRQDDERFQVQHQRFLIPAAGPTLESFLEHVDSCGRAHWGPALEVMHGQLLPALTSEWMAIRRRVFVDPDQRPEVWQEMEAGLEELSACVGDLGDASVTEDEALNAFEAAAQHLSDLFHSLRQQTLPYGHLYGSEAGQLLEGIFGALGGSVPVVHLKELCAGASAAVSRQLDRYAQEGDWDALFRAGYALLQEFPAPVVAQAEDTTWSCPFCGFANPLGARSCAGCHASACLSTTSIGGHD